MKKFVDRTTGAVLEPSSDFVAEQMEKSGRYDEYTEAEETEEETATEAEEEPAQKRKRK